jgi:DNA (cytosine-5)-methyltransferase 1
MRAGLAGERSALFFDLARVASVVLAPGGWLVIENVDGLLSSGRGRDFAVVLATLAELGFHDLAWRVLNSRYFGVPQRRRRVFIVARRARGRSAAEVLLEPQSGGGDHQAGCKAGSRVASTLVSGSSSRGVSAPGRRQDDDQNIVNALDRNAGGPDDNAAQAGHIVGALTRRDGKGPNSDCDNGQIISPPLLGEGHDASEDGTGRQALISSTLSTNPRGGGGSNGATQAKDLVATADPDREGAPSRLPGRLDDSTRPLACPFDPSPDGPREAQMGNAVTVSVAEWIGRRILDFESGPDLLITTARRRTDD